MILRIEPQAATPPYEQLRAQLTAMITTGGLPPGERMPSIRQLAGDLGLAPGTVRRAYTELERAGLVHTRRGRHGSFVADKLSAASAEEREELLWDAARRYAVAVRQSGLGDEKGLARVKDALAELPGTA